MRYYSLITSMSFGKLQTMINNFKNRIISEFALFESESCLCSTLVNLDHIAVLDKASLIVTPNATKASNLYSIKPSDGSGDLTVVRATTAPRVNSSGIIESVAANVPRLDYTNSTCPSILVEPQRTNVVLQSSDLSKSVWSKTNYTLSSITSIQGLTATRITKNATNNGFYLGTGSRNLVNIIGTFASGTKTLSFLIRKGNTDKVGFVINGVLVGALTSVNCEFNFNTKTFTNVSSGLTVSYENPLTDVYKIILTINDTGVLTSKSIWIAPIDASNNTVYGGYLDFAYAQWELGSYATSYIPTVASTVTRNADVISKTGISSLIGQTEGTIFIDFNNQLLSSTILCINKNSTNSVFLTTSSLGELSGRIYANSIVYLVSFSGYTTFNEKIKMSLKYGSFGIKLFINGQLKSTNVNPIIFTAALSSLNLNDEIVLNANSTIRNNGVLVFPTALTDVECIQLTT